MKKILFYYNHQEDLGHLVRLLNIVKAINYYYKKQSQVFIFQAGKKQSFIKFPKHTRVFYLPSPFYNRLNLKIPVQLNPQHVKTRINFMLSQIKTIKPDIFITEFFPFGRPECKYELLPILRWVRNKRIRIYSSLPFPYFCHSKGKIKELLFFANFYDKVLIHTPANLDLKYISNNIHLEKRISKQDFLSIFRYLKNKIYFTGYILSVNNTTRREHITDDNFIVIHRGGGTTSPEIITHAILAQRLLDNKYKFLVVVGPATTKLEMRIFKNLIEQTKNDNIILRKYLPDFFNYLKHSQLCVGTAGGTIYELLYFKKKSIVVPFMGYLDRERADQISRAQLLKDYAGATILNYDSLTPKILAQQIIKKLSSSKLSTIYKKINDNWFNGAKITADIITQSS